MLQWIGSLCESVQCICGRAGSNPGRADRNLIGISKVLLAPIDLGGVPLPKEPAACARALLKEGSSDEPRTNVTELPSITG